MLGSFAWGFVAASSLILGGAYVLRFGSANAPAFASSVLD
jgi:hypothetical protein